MRESQPVDYVRLNLAIRRLCLANLALSWASALILLAMFFTGFAYALGVVPIAVMMVSLFLSCVFAFGAIATNSISGQNRLRLNLIPVLCIFLSCPSVGFWVSLIADQIGY